MSTATITPPNRFRPEGDNHLYDAEEGCYYVRERHSVEKFNATIEEIALLIERSAEARMALAVRIRRMKRRV